MSSQAASSVAEPLPEHAHGGLPKPTSLPQRRRSADGLAVSDQLSVAVDIDSSMAAARGAWGALVGAWGASPEPELSVPAAAHTERRTRVRAMLSELRDIVNKWATSWAPPAVAGGGGGGGGGGGSGVWGGAAGAAGGGKESLAAALESVLTGRGARGEEAVQSQSQSQSHHAHLYTFGSFKLDADVGDADVDVLVLVPKHMSRGARLPHRACLTRHGPHRARTRNLVVLTHVFGVCLVAATHFFGELHPDMKRRREQESDGEKKNKKKPKKGQRSLFELLNSDQRVSHMVPDGAPAFCD